MPKTYELTSELASLRSDWHELDRACSELSEGLHIQGLMQFAMTRLDDRIKVLERNLAVADANQSPRLGGGSLNSPALEASWLQCSVARADGH